MSDDYRNICLLSLLLIFYFSYCYWQNSDSYTNFFISEDIEIVENSTGITPEYQDDKKQFQYITISIDSEILTCIASLQNEESVNNCCEIELNENFKKLISYGNFAVNKMLEALRKSNNTRIYILLRALEKIEGISVRDDLEELLPICDSEKAIQIANSLLRLNSTESIPILEKLLLNINDDNFNNYINNIIIELKIYKIERGNYEDIFKVLPINFSESNNLDNIYKLLSKYPPIQDYFNFNDFKYLDENNKLCFLKAVNEWYFEQILNRPSPYKVDINFKFQEPYAEVKYKAWDLLATEVNKMDKFKVIRALPKDIDIFEANLKNELTIITGNGHGGFLGVYHFKPSDTRVIINTYIHRYGNKRTSFDEDSGNSIFQKFEVDIDAYQSLLVSLHIIFSAEIFEWWSGNKHGNLSSTNDFAFILSGLEADHILGYCGYPSSKERAIQLKYIIAKDLIYDFFNNKNIQNLNEPVESNLFPQIFKSTMAIWTNTRYWWVCSRMLELANEFGDYTLLDSLEFYLKVKTDNITDSRNKYKSINAIANITKKDFRFSTEGSPKPIEIVSREYIEYLSILPR